MIRTTRGRPSSWPASSRRRVVTYLVDLPTRHGPAEVFARSRFTEDTREREKEEGSRAKRDDDRAIFARALRSRPSHPSRRCRVTSREERGPVTPRQVTGRNTTVRCGHLSLSRVASQNKTLPTRASRYGRNGSRCKERNEEKDRSGMPRMFPHRLLPASSYRSLFPPDPPVLVHPTRTHRLLSSSLFTDLFRLSLAAPDIFTALCRRVDLVCITPLLLSGPALAVRPPKLSRRYDLCFLRPSGGLIPFCCRMYTCATAPLPASPLRSLCLSLSLPPPRRLTRDLRTRLSSARHAVDGLLLVPGSHCLGFFRDFFSAVLSPSPAPSPPSRFLPLTALYRLVTSVSRAGDLRAGALGTGD